MSSEGSCRPCPLRRDTAPIGRCGFCARRLIVGSGRESRRAFDRRSGAVAGRGRRAWRPDNGCCHDGQRDAGHLWHSGQHPCSPEHSEVPRVRPRTGTRPHLMSPGSASHPARRRVATARPEGRSASHVPVSRRPSTEGPLWGPPRQRTILLGDAHGSHQKRADERIALRAQCPRPQSGFGGRWKREPRHGTHCVN